MLETVEEIDEAIRHTLATPPDARNSMWHDWLDSLLDKRNRLAGTPAQRRETRIVAFSEQR